MKYKCPCCGYYTLEEPPGNYEICPVCFWEDDPKAASAPNIAFGANHISLKVARMNFREIGACDPDAVRSVRDPEEGEIDPAAALTVIRAKELWEKAGSYYVRIRANGQRYGIDLKTEFDEHDTEETKYVVLLDNGHPVATCRLYPCDEGYMMMGRVVVLPEYEKRGIGSKVIREGEDWARELGYKRVVIEARAILADFYEKRGYSLDSKHLIHREPFDCIQMEKKL